MPTTKYWIATKRDGTESLLVTFSTQSFVFNADGSAAKQITEDEAKAWKSKEKKERRKKK